MTVNLVTSEEIKALKDELLAAINGKSQDPDFVFLTVKEAAAMVKHSKDTVHRWINEGKRDMDGSVRRLPLYKFSESDVRIRLSDLVAYGKLEFRSPFN